MGANLSIGSLPRRFKGATFTNLTELDRRIGNRESAGVLRADELAKCVETLSKVGVRPLQALSLC